MRFVISSKGFSCRPGKRSAQGANGSVTRADSHNSSAPKPNSNIAQTERKFRKPRGPNGQFDKEFSRTGSEPQFEIPSEIELLIRWLGRQFELHPYSLLGATLAVAGAALGNGAVLDSSVSAAPINAGLHYCLCGVELNRGEKVVQAIAQPLRDEQDKKLTQLRLGVKAIEKRIREIEVERESFFGADPVRHLKAEANFALRINELLGVLHPTLVAENRVVGALNQAVMTNAGAGLLVLYNHWGFARLLSSPKGGAKDLEMMARAWQGKTPEQSSFSHTRNEPIVRPAMSCLFLSLSDTAGKLLCSAEGGVREFAEQVIFCPTSHGQSSTVSDLGQLRQAQAGWSNLITRLVGLRSSGTFRGLTLSGKAAAVLENYANKINQQRCEHDRWGKHAPIQSAKVALLLHCISDGAGPQISERVMLNAIAMTGWLVKESAATALRCITGDQERTVHKEAAEMLRKLKDFGRSAWPRELYRTYSKQEKDLHEPALELLVRTGQVHRLDDGSVEPTSATDEGHS